MGRIKNTDKYSYKSNINPLDYLIGSDSENNGETVTFKIEDIATFYNNGTNAYVEDVQLVGTDLDFTGVGFGFGGSVDLSSLLDGNDFVSNVQLNGTDLDFTGSGGAFTGSVDLSSLLDGNVSNVQLNSTSLDFTGTGSAFNGSVELGSINTDNFVSNVQLNSTNLDFTGSGGAFNASVDLSSIDTNDIDYISNIVLNNNQLEVTGQGNAFNDSVNLYSIIAGENIIVEDETTSNVFTASSANFEYTIRIKRIGDFIHVNGFINNVSGVVQAGQPIFTVSNGSYYNPLNSVYFYSGFGDTTEEYYPLSLNSLAQPTPTFSIDKSIPINDFIRFDFIYPRIEIVI